MPLKINRGGSLGKISKLLLAVLISLNSVDLSAAISLSNQLIVEGQTVHDNSHASTGQVKVFWWNIAGEGFTQKAPALLAKQPGHDPIQMNYWKRVGAVRGNLLQHIKIHQPDIIILGELPTAKIVDFELLFPSYVFSEVIPYVPGSKSSILVLSRLKILPHFSGQMSITPVQNPNSPNDPIDPKKIQDNQNFWKKNRIQSRNFTMLEVQLPNQEFYLSPLHFVNPWPTYAKVYRSGNFPGAGTLSYMDVAVKQMLNGEVSTNKQGQTIYNPLQNQARDFIQKIHQQGLTQAPVLFIGDFNSPSRILPYGYPRFLDPRLLVPSKAHRLFAKYFKAPFMGKFKDVETIPTETGGQGKPRVRIDKAFTTDLIETHQMWIFKYSGSDHYPIQIEFAIKD